MKLCSKDSECGYKPSPQYKNSAELILEISRDYENKHNHEKLKEMVSLFIGRGYNLSFRTNFKNIEKKESINLILITSNNKSIKIFFNQNQIENFSDIQIEKMRLHIEKNLC